MPQAPGTATLWNGVAVRTYAHVDGRGGPQNLKGAWSEPLNRTTNTLCSLDTNDPKLRCPLTCSRSHFVRKKRLRQAIHRMSDEEWQRVVDAMWVLRTVDTFEGRSRFGPEYRNIDFHIVRHVLGTLPGLDRVRSGELKEPPMDVTGGNAHTYTWHALFGMEVETSLMLVDPRITGLPYFDWGAMISPAVASIYRARLGVGTAEPSASEAASLGELGSQDVLNAWKAYQRAHPGLTSCTGSARRECEPRLLMDGSFARWPVPPFEWDEWYASQSPAVRRLFSYVHRRADAIVHPLTHRGQLRCNASGTSVHVHPADRHSDDATAANRASSRGASRGRPPLPYVVRGLDTDFDGSALPLAQPLARGSALPLKQPLAWALAAALARHMALPFARRLPSCSILPR